jgi:hypothetical protein
MTTKSKVGTIHVIAVCQHCQKRWEDYITGIDSARRHADETGHCVTVERGQTWTYNATR